MTTSSELIDQEEEQVFKFEPTGNEFKDKILKSIITQSECLFEDASKADKWKYIVASPNPAGEAEIFAVSQYVKHTENVLPVLLKVKKTLAYNRDGMTILKAYQKYKLEDIIKRIDVDKLKLVKHTCVQLIDEEKNEYKTEHEYDVEDDTETTSKVDSWRSNTLSSIKRVPKGTYIVNPENLFETYTFGAARGRAAKWIYDYLEKHPELIK